MNVAAHGLQRHAQLFGQLFDRDRAAASDDTEEMELSWIQIHVHTLLARVEDCIAIKMETTKGKYQSKKIKKEQK